MSDDPAYAGTMTMTWEVAAVDGGTRVDITAVDDREGGEATHLRLNGRTHGRQRAVFVSVSARNSMAIDKPAGLGHFGARPHRCLRAD